MVLGRSLQGNKQEKKFKLATRTSRLSSGGNGTSVSTRKGESRSKKVEIGGNRAIGVSHDGKSKGTKTGVFGKRDVKSRNNGERHESLAEGNWDFKSLSFDKKRKRSDNNAVRQNKNIPSEMVQNMRRDSIHEDRQTTTVKSYKLERRSPNASLTGRRNSTQSKIFDNKKSGARAKAVYKVKDDEVEGARNYKLKKSAKGKSEPPKQSEQEQSKIVIVSSERPLKKVVQNKKSTTDDSERMDERPKKKKRRIRIDPYDTSNKRLDDGMVINNKVQKKEEDSKSTEIEMSKNAQFRAILPSPSILSFVEDNLLGRRREIEFRRAGYNIEFSAPLDNIPHSSSLEREQIEETVFRNNLTFFAAAKISASFPSPELPEIAFAGKSNVGKSSLLNALTRQWGVVRTSDKPGLTQTINFFKLASKLCLVDLPGYGFAYAKEDVKEAWEELVKEYVSTRVGLKRVCLLVDTKWGMKPRDHELIDLMERSQTKYQIVLTKTDMVFPIDVARRAMQIEESLKEKKSAVQPVMMVSSKTGAGIRSLRTVLTKIARFVKP